MMAAQSVCCTEQERQQTSRQRNTDIEEHDIDIEAKPVILGNTDI
jgi:hypothetical protein